MMRKRSSILNNAIFRRKTPEPEESSEFSEEKKTLIDIIMNTEKIKKFIQMILQNDNNYGVKIRFCAAVLEYEKVIGTDTDTEHKMKNSLTHLFLRDDSMFKINTCHKDLIKIKNEVIDGMLKDLEILKILNILKDHA